VLHRRDDFASRSTDDGQVPWLSQAGITLYRGQGRIKRVGHGFRNFDNYRLRLLMHCGVEWHSPDSTPLRGRLPRFIA
jgi:hypothetical protein